MTGWLLILLDELFFSLGGHQAELIFNMSGEVNQSLKFLFSQFKRQYRGNGGDRSVSSLAAEQRHFTKALALVKDCYLSG